MKRKLKFKEKIEIISWVFNEVNKVDRNYIPLQIINIVISLLNIYIPIFLYTPILENLKNNNTNNALFYSGLLVISLFIFPLINKIITRRNNSYKEYISTSLDNRMYLHNLEVDYGSLIENKNKEAFAKAMSAFRYEIGGFTTLFQRLFDLVKEFLSFFLSIYITIRFLLSVPGNFSKNVVTNQIVNFLSTPINSSSITFIVILFTMAVMVLGQNYVSKIRREYFNNHAEVENRSLYIAREIVYQTKNFSHYQIYNFKNFLDEKFDIDRIESKEFFVKGDFLYSLFTFINGILSTVLLVLSYGLVAIKVKTGAINISNSVTYIKGFNQMNLAINNILRIYLILDTSLPYFIDIKNFMDLKNNLDTGTIPTEKRSDYEVELEFKNVSFKYPNTDKYVLKNLNLKLNMNKKHALVGPNGSGKTTFINLLCRLFDPTEGEILLNGINIKKYNYNEYLNIFSVVFQDYKLLALPVGENISCSEKYDKEKIINILKLMDFKDDNMEVSQDLLLRKVSGLKSSKPEFSGGQMQKLAIARSLYKNSSVSILDEPTAALDPKSESEIYDNLNTLINNKTTVFISHRMSSCKFCEDIIVFNNGQVEERGNHNELIKNNKLYTKMWNAQAKYYV